MLDWVESKSRELVKAAGTIDAWSGPQAKTSPLVGLSKGDVKLLESGDPIILKAGLSERTKRVMIVSMIVSMGGLMGWCMFGLTQKTKAEGSILPSNHDKKLVPAAEEKENRPGVFVWGSNR